MDFQGMKRKQLQALCKKHGFPANLTNREMADRLASMFQETEEPVSSEKLRMTPEDVDDEAKVVKKQLKKVRFSPQNETFVYEVSVYRRPGRRSRKKSSPKKPAQVIENVPDSENIRKTMDYPVRTRSRVQKAVQGDVNMVFSPLVERKKERGGMKNGDAEMNSKGKSEASEMGDRNDAKNDNGKVTGRATRRHLSSVTQEDSKKIGKRKGVDEVHSLDESFEEGGVVNGSKKSTRKPRKEVQSATLSSAVEKPEVVSKVRRQSRAQPKDAASIVMIEAKNVGVQGEYEEVLQLKTQKGRRRNALRQNAVPLPESDEAEIRLVPEAAEAEKPLRRSKRNMEKDCATAQHTGTQVTKFQEQLEGDRTKKLVECLRRYSSRRKSVLPQSNNAAHEEKHGIMEARKRFRTSDLEANVEHASEVESPKCVFTSQDQPPPRRSRRKTVIVNDPAHTDTELVNEEDTGRIEQIRAAFPEKEENGDLPRKSARNANRNSSSGTSKEDHNTFGRKGCKGKRQRKESPLEEEKTYVAEHNPVYEMVQRRYDRISSRSTSMAVPSTAKVVKKNQRGKSRMMIIEDKATVSESHPPHLELSAGKDELHVAEGAWNKNELDLNISKQVIKNSPGSSNQKGKELAGNTGEKKQCEYAEVPLFPDMKEFKDYARSMEEALITTSVKLVDISADQEKQQSAHKSIVVYEKESKLARDDREKLANVANDVNCMSYQSDGTICLLEYPSCLKRTIQKMGTNVCHLVDSSEITYPASNKGPEICDEEMKEDVTSIDTHSGLKPLVVHMEDRSAVESEKESLVQVDTADREMSHDELSRFVSERVAVEDPNLDKSIQAELESNGITMFSPEITFPANGLSLEIQTDLTGPTNTLQNPDIQLKTELTGDENTSFVTENVNADYSRTSFGENQIEKLFNSESAVETLREATFNLKDHQNEFGNSSDLKTGSENALKRSEGLIALDIFNREGISDTESLARATENLETTAEVIFSTAENSAQKITEIQQSTCRNTDASESPCEPSQENQGDVAETAGSGVFDQATIGDVNPGSAHCFHDSVFFHQEITGSVNNDKEFSFHEDTFEVDISYHSCLSLNGTGAVADSTNSDEPRKVDLESSDSKLDFTEMTSPVSRFTSTSQAAGKISSYIDDPLTAEIMNPNDIVSEECKSLEKDLIMQLEDAKVTAAKSVEEVIFNDLLKELGESFGLKKRSGISAKTGKLTASEFSDGEGIAITRTSAKSTKKQEQDEVETDIVNQITGTPNIPKIKWCSNSGNTTCRTPPFGLAVRDEDKLCSAGTTVSIARRKMWSQDEETSLVKDDKIADSDNILERERIYEPCPSQTKTSVLNEAGEARKVEFKTNANKAVYSEGTSLANVCLSTSKANLAGETSYGLELEKRLESEESPRAEILNYRNDKTEFENEKDFALDDQNPNHLENDSSIAEGVQEFIVRNHLSQPFESCSSKQSEVSLKKAEEMSGSDSSEKGLIQAENSVQINGKEEASSKIIESSVDITDEALKLDNESNAAKLVSDEEVRARIFGNANQLQDHLLMDGGMNRSGQKVMEPFKSYFSATMCSNESGSRETNVGLDANMMEKISISGTNIELGMNGDSKVDSGLCAADVNLLEKIFQETEVFTVASTEATEEMPNALVGAKQQFVKANCGDVDDKSVVSLGDCSIGLGHRDGGKTAVSHQRSLHCDKEDLDSSFMDSNSKLKSSDPQCGTKVEDPHANGFGSTGVLDFIPASISDAANEFDTAFMVEEAGAKDGGKTPVSHQGSLYCEKEDLASSIMENDLKLKSGNPQYGTKVEDPDANGSVSTGTLDFIPADVRGADAANEIDALLMVEETGDEDSGKTPISCQNYLNGKQEDVLQIVDKNSVKSKDPQLGTKMEDTDVNDGLQAMLEFDSANTSATASEFNAVFIVEAGPDDGAKTPVSHPRFLHGHKQEHVPTYANKLGSKSETSIAASTLLCSNIPISSSKAEKELSQVMNDTNDDKGGTEFSNDRKVEKRKDKAEAKSEDCEGSEKSSTFMSGKNIPLSTEESDGLHLHDSKAGDCMGFESCTDNAVPSVKPEIIIHSSSTSSNCATSEEDKHVKNTDDWCFITNTDMNLLWGVEEEVKEPDAMACEISHAAVDKFNQEFCSTLLKDDDYIACSDLEDIKFSEQKDDSKDIGFTIELRKELDESPLKDSELGQVEPQEAFRSELDLAFSQKKSKTAVREESKSVCVKQLTSSIMKSKKCSMIQRTPKRLIIHDMKENETSTKKVGSRTTPRTCLKRRPLENIWKP